ncbi:MAG TPA: PfkB family carbohydrate kinase [Candidatus Limnocylindria bacterium]
MTGLLVVGDAILDVTVAPSRPMRPGGDVAAVIRLGAGGQGANVAVRLARRGASVRLAAPVSDDVSGRLLREALSGDGVQLADMPASRTAVVVALLDAGGERSMLSDRQTIDTARVEAAMPGHDWIHVSAYALVDDREGDALAAALGRRPAGARLSLAGGSIAPEPAVVSRFLSRLEAARPDLLVVSREEAAALLGKPAQLARDHARDLAGRAPLVLVTAGSAGSVAAIGGEIHEVPAPELPGPALDSTGAGDAYVAAVIADLAIGEWPPAVDDLRAAMERGSRAGGLVARVVGAQGRIEGEATAT